MRRWMAQLAKDSCIGRGLIDIRQAMNEPAQPSIVDGDRRSAPRASVMLQATLERAGATSIVRLVSLSQMGSSITGHLPPKHSSVTLHRKGAALRGRIVWASDGRGGVAFNDAVDLREMLRIVTVRRQTPRYCAEGRPRVGRCLFSRAEREHLHRCASLLGISLTEPSL